MQICANCFKELFDSDIKCDICGSEDIISDMLYKKTRKELETMSDFKRKHRVKDYPYNVVYKYLTMKYGERYWREIHSKPYQGESLYPRKETPTQPTKPKSVCCPKCGSTSIATTARGVDGFWGLIGASKTVNRCANCGYTWKPKKK
jgi:DNA-directed RNA polymerase subunit M/transcription elongation factor TFIIS